MLVLVCEVLSGVVDDGTLVATCEQAVREERSDRIVLLLPYVFCHTNALIQRKKYR